MAFRNHSNDHDGIMISNSIKLCRILKEHISVLLGGVFFFVFVFVFVFWYSKQYKNILFMLPI